MQELFERDVECIVRFFSKKLGYVPERDEELEVIRPSFQVSNHLSKRQPFVTFGGVSQRPCF